MSDQVSFTETSSLLKIKRSLDGRFGKKAWARWEPETIALETGIDLTQLMVDKLSLLRIIDASPLQVFEDPVLFLHAAEVINNNVADFGVVPHLTILETGYAVFSIKQVLRDSSVVVEYPESIKKAITYILRHEGASEPIAPLDFVSADDLEKGQTVSDTDAKKKAMAEYIKHMESL